MTPVVLTSLRYLQLLGLARSRPVVALADQMVVSGTSFVTMIMVGRYCGAEGLGTFSLLLSLLLLANAAQLSLVCAPFTVFRLRGVDDDSPRVRAGSVATGAGFLTAVLTILSIVAAIIVSFASTSVIAEVAAWALAISLPGYLVRDFARRFDFARLQMTGALLLDTSVCVLQLVAIYALGRTGQLSGPRAIVLIAAASLVGSAIWFLRRREEFTWRRERVLPTIKHDWRFGRWLMIDNLVCITQLYAMHWMLTGMIGTSAAGVFAACLSIAALANPFLQGVGNYLSPKIAETVSLRSRGATMVLYWRATAGLVFVVAIFTAVIFLFSQELLGSLYKGTVDQANAGIVALLALRMLCSAPTIAADHAVVAMESPKASAIVSLLGVVLTVVIAYPLILRYGVTGAAVALLIGTAVESAALVVVFVHKLNRWSWHPATSTQGNFR